MRKARRIATLVLIMNIVAGMTKVTGRWHPVVLIFNAVVVLVLAVIEMDNRGER